MMVTISALMNAAPGRQTAQGSMDAAPGEDFNAELAAKTQQLFPQIQEERQQPAPLPAAEVPVNIGHEAQGDVFDSPDNLPDSAFTGKPDETADEPVPVLAEMSVGSQLVHLQTLVMQMDAANTGVAGAATAAGTAQQTAAVTVDAQGEETTANSAQAALTLLKGMTDGGNAAPTAAALAKQNYSFAGLTGKEAKHDAQPAPGLPVALQVEKPEQMVSLFKPVVEGAVAIAADGHSSFTPAATVHTHTAPGSSLLVSHAASVPVTAAPAPVLTQEMGTAAWQQSLGQQIAMFTRNGIHNAEIRLNPAELGVLKINLRMNSDQASLHFVSENHQVRAALEAAMPQLRTSLAESGINLEASRVDSGSAQSWSGSAHSEWSSGQKAQDDNGGDAPQADTEEVIIRPAQIRHNSGINTFV
ncbi:flagellar hook-length control protein FliK [Dryocola sp. BD613]|uniref:flagellar hook-length control protein FliK n=1 Tax=Dryocola sp. BD613 TaxID=3133272 RepID=UPI003F50251B